MPWLRGKNGCPIPGWPRSTCQSVVEQDTETQIAAGAATIGVWVQVWTVTAGDEQVAPGKGSHRHACKNV